MSITIDISDELLEEVGREEVEKEMQEAVRRLERRQIARELLHDLDDIDLSNDPAYQKAREEAWVIYTQIHNLAPDGRRKH